MKALHLMIYGRVQGVWFGPSTQETGASAQNSRVGSQYDLRVGVEAHIQGDAVGVGKNAVMVLVRAHRVQRGRYRCARSRWTRSDEFKAFTIRYY